MLLAIFQMLSILNSGLVDPMQDKPMDPMLLKEGQSALTSNPLEISSKFPVLLRKMVGQICRELSPQESFEFRLQSRIDYRHVPFYANASPVEKGIAYHVTNADWLSLDGEDIRTFVEDDDRYNVDWGNFFDFNVDSKSGSVVFMPKDPLPYMERPNETKDSSVSGAPPRVKDKGKPRKRFYSPTSFHGPTDPLVEKKAELLRERACQARANIVNDYFKQMEGVWAMMSPKDAFTSRLGSWSDFRGGPNIEEVDEDQRFFREDDEEYFPEFKDDDDDSAGTVFHIEDAYYGFPSRAFKEFLQGDDRCIVHWGSFEPKLTWCGHKYRWSNDRVRGFIRFMPKSVTPKRKKLNSQRKKDEIDDEEDDSIDDNEGDEEVDDEEDDENVDNNESNSDNENEGTADVDGNVNLNHASESLLLEKTNALVEKTRQEHLDHRKDFYMKLGEICALLSPRDSFVVRLNSRSVFEEGCMIWQKYEGQEEEMFSCGKNTDMFDVYNSNCFEDPQFKQFLESDDRYIVEYIMDEMEKEERADGGKGTIAFALKTPMSHKEGNDE